MTDNAVLSHLLACFEDNYKKAFKKTKRKNKKFIKELHASFFRRFYYSSLCDGLEVTPALLFQMSVANSPDCLDIAPQGFFKNGAYSVDVLPYSLDEHYFIKDLKIITEICCPSFEMNDKNGPTETLLKKIAPLVSIKSEMYVTYIFELLWELGVLTEMPSIKGSYGAITEKCEALLKLDDKLLFKRIVEACAKMFADKLNDIVNDGATYDAKYVLKILKKPAYTDDLFEKFIGNQMNIDELEDLLELMETGLEDLNEGEKNGVYEEFLGKLMSFDEVRGAADKIMTGKLKNEDATEMIMNALEAKLGAGANPTFRLGMCIDQYFFTPFSLYLKLINCVYLESFDMHTDMELLVDVYEDTQVFSELYEVLNSPCSMYTHTPLGKKYFGFVPPKYKDIPKKNLEIGMKILKGEIDPWESNFMRRKTQQLFDQNMFDLQNINNDTFGRGIFDIGLFGDDFSTNTLDFLEEQDGQTSSRFLTAKGGEKPKKQSKDAKKGAKNASGANILHILNEYTLKVSLQSNEAMWIKIKFPGGLPLVIMYEGACLTFGIDICDDFVFYLNEDKTGEKYCMFPANDGEKSANSVELMELLPQVGQKLLLELHNKKPSMVTGIFKKNSKLMFEVLNIESKMVEEKAVSIIDFSPLYEKHFLDM